MVDVPALTAVLRSFARRRIAFLGDAILDRTPKGRAAGFGGGAPVPVVGLNADDPVRRLKGADRSVNPLADCPRGRPLGSAWIMSRPSRARPRTHRYERCGRISS